MKNGTDMVLEISQLIGQPINTQLPVAVEIAAIADILPMAKPGELVYKFSALDNTADTILDINANGTINVKKRSPVGYTLLEFKTLESQLEHVYIEDVLNSVDTDVFARRNASITRGMDKRELKTLIDALLDITNTMYPESGVSANAITPSSGDDVYDILMEMKHAIEDYGDGYTLLCGSSVKSAIDLYKKAKSLTQNYNVDLLGDLAKMGFKIVKVFGKVADDTGETQDAVMNANKAILIATNSTIAEGKPIKFVRRQISPDIASLMGAKVDDAQRAIIVNPVPVIDSGANKRAIGVYGLESFVAAIVNPLAISTCDLTTIL
jgi:hypothetical protein